MNKNKQAKNIWAFLKFPMTLVLLCIGLISVSFPVSAVPPMSVQGNKVLVGGQSVSLGGMSYFWANNGWGGEKFYNASTVAHLKNDWRVSIVRAAMGVEDNGGYFSDPAGMTNKVRTIVDAAIANDIYVIIDWHSHHAHTHNWNEAISFFQQMARDYGHHNNVIYEIYNEPLQVSWSSAIKPYAEAVIDAIRQIDPDNLIVVGTPTWSQGVKEASWDPINRNNIAYTLHFYAGTHHQWLRNDAAEAMRNGIALFVTEWGTVNADGNGAVNQSETTAWLNFMRDNGIHHANWSVNDKSEGASILWPGSSTTGGWSSGNLTQSGQLIRNQLRSWAQIPGGGGTNPPPTQCNRVDIPGTIEAENFCAMQGIQTENTTDAGGGQNVGWIDQGDWLSYSVDVLTGGDYTVSYRVASQNGGGFMQLEQAGGGAVFGTIDVPNTGGWQNWRTISHNVRLNAGQQDIAISAQTGGFNINWIHFEPSGSTPQPTAQPTPQPTPPPSGNFSVVIQAEDYNNMNGVQTENTSDAGGGQNVGWLDAGDWMSYPSINIPQTGTYEIEFRVASRYGGGRLQFERAGGNPVYTTVNIPNTGSWQSWISVTQRVQLNAGNQAFAISVLSGGWNINWYKITKVN